MFYGCFWYSIYKLYSVKRHTQTFISTEYISKLNNSSKFHAKGHSIIESGTIRGRANWQMVAKRLAHVESKMLCSFM